MSQDQTTDELYAVVVIEPSGAYQFAVTPRITHRGTLPFLQHLVGGLIEVVPTGNPDVELYVNEEGKIDGLPRNPIAELIWAHLAGVPFPEGEWIAGNLVIAGPVDENGEQLAIELTGATQLGLGHEYIECMFSARDGIAQMRADGILKAEGEL